MTARRWDRLARGSILALGSALQGGTLVVRDQDGAHVLGHGGEGAHMTIHDQRVWGMVAAGGGKVVEGAQVSKRGCSPGQITGVLPRRLAAVRPVGEGSP